MTDMTVSRLEAPLLPHSVAAAGAIRRIAFIALSSIVLGFAMQGVILAGKLSAGARLPGAGFLVDLLQGVTWSLLVCMGIGIGTSILKARPALVGLLGVVFAPLALAVSKSGQKMMTSLLGLSEQTAALPLYALGGLKAIEYGLLGWLLGRLALKGEARATPYLATGLLTGATFGSAISVLTYQSARAAGADMQLPQILASIINEVLFPVGCSLVIYLGQIVVRNLGIINAGGR